MLFIFSNTFFQVTIRVTIIMENSIAKKFAKNIVVTFVKHAKFVWNDVAQLNRSYVAICTGERYANPTYTASGNQFVSSSLL